MCACLLYVAVSKPADMSLRVCVTCEPMGTRTACSVHCNCVWQECLHMYTYLDFPGSSVGKESACRAGVAGYSGSIPGSGKTPWRRQWQPTPVFLPRGSHGQGSLAGCSPRARRESDTTERVSTQAGTHDCTCVRMRVHLNGTMGVCACQCGGVSAHVWV